MTRFYHVTKNSFQIFSQQPNFDKQRNEYSHRNIQTQNENSVDYFIGTEEVARQLEEKKQEIKQGRNLSRLTAFGDRENRGFEHMVGSTRQTRIKETVMSLGKLWLYSPF